MHNRCVHDNNYSGRAQETCLSADTTPTTLSTLEEVKHQSYRVRKISQGESVL